MNSARIAGVLAAIVAASTLVSCGDDDPRARDGDRREVLKQKHKGHRANGDTIKVKSKPQPQPKEQNESREQKPGNGKAEEPAADTQPDDHGNSQEPNRDDREKKAEPAEACADDMSGDMEGAGAMPAYADLQRGCLREEGTHLVLAATTVGALPGRMPDRNTNLALGFELTTKSDDSVYVGAESTTDGWTAYFSKDGASRSIGAPKISGSQLLMVIPVSELGGADRLSWNVESSWLRSTLTSTEYAFDDAPNGSVSTFDRG